MSLTQAYYILKEHQHWRRCHNDDCECKQASPVELGQAIDFILQYIEQDLINDL